MTDIIDTIREQCRGDVAHKHQVQMIRLYQLEEARKRVDRARTAAELDMAEDDLRVGREHWAEVEGRELKTRPDDHRHARMSSGDARQLAHNAVISQRIKHIMRDAPGWDDLDSVLAEALVCLALKVSRILSGRANEPEHWRDLIGYCRRALEQIGKAREVDSQPF